MITAEKRVAALNKRIETLTERMDKLSERLLRTGLTTQQYVRIVDQYRALEVKCSRIEREIDEVRVFKKLPKTKKINY